MRLRRPEGASGGLSACLVRSCAQRSDFSTQREFSTRYSPGIQFSAGCALIIRLIIQMIRQDRSVSVWTDEASNLSRPDPSGSDQIDAEHQATDLVH